MEISPLGYTNIDQRKLPSEIMYVEYQHMCKDDNPDNPDNPDIKTILIFELNNKILQYIIDNNYVSLIIDYNFYKDTLLINNIPSTIKYLEFDYESEFTEPLNNLPTSLIYLKLSDVYNHPLNNLPLLLEYLICGAQFNQVLDFLPPCLKYISLSDNFNYPLDVLPDNLLYLYIHSCVFNQPIIYKLPTSLIVLNIRIYYPCILTIECVENLTNLREIYLCDTVYFDINNVIWPDTITLLHLDCYDNYNIPLINLPKNLEKLEVSYPFDIYTNIIKVDNKVDNKVILPLSLQTFTYFDMYPKTDENIKQLNELSQLYPAITVKHK